MVAFTGAFIKLSSFSLMSNITIIARISTMANTYVPRNFLMI